MRIQHAYAVPAIALALAFAISAAYGDELKFQARLSGAEEVPPVDTDTSGRATIEFNEDFSAVEFQLRVSDGERVTQAHIHCAPSGVNGPIVAFLAGFHSLGWDVDGKWVDNATLTDDNIIPPPAVSTCPHTVANLADLFAAMAAGDTYVNVHSVDNPGGVVRGQVEEDRED